MNANNSGKSNADKKLVIKSEKDEFKVMLNPVEYSETNSIRYTGIANSKSKKFVRQEGSIFSIPKILLDTTGVVPENDWPVKGSIKAMIEKLNNIVYKLNGKAHQPSVVEVQWGTTHFKGRLKKMDIKYVLFDLNGEPLRAELNLNFVIYETIKELEAEYKKSSPDLTHIIEVKAGDTLPNLCNKIYKDPSFYMQVARVNQFSTFCRLKPGMRLVFPPLVD